MPNFLRSLAPLQSRVHTGTDSPHGTPLATFVDMRFLSRGPSLLSALSLLVLLRLPSALAWGPHPEITRAALSTLTKEHPLRKLLGDDVSRLERYVWMADWRQQLMVHQDEVFYADDFLLFPKAPRHLQHICPEVEQTYAPYFRRALQALKTESPKNAARWIGAILHFTTDTGSPPHAAGFLGPAHSKMENWVDATAILLPDYRASLLGPDPESALAGFLQRMRGLIAFSKERALRCRADVDADRRPEVEPVVLESALETARVTADLLHTLGTLAANSNADPSISGKVVFPTHPDPVLKRLPAKVVLLGTDFSTLTQPDGTFTFSNLPHGTYTLNAATPGSEIASLELSIPPKNASPLSVQLSQKPDGNLLRNPGFNMRWVSRDEPDFWQMKTLPAKLAAATGQKDWNSEWVPLEDGATYACNAVPTKDAEGTRFFVRTKSRKDPQTPPVETEPVAPSETSVVVKGGPDAGWAQVCIRSSAPPAQALKEVVFRKRD